MLDIYSYKCIGCVSVCVCMCLELFTKLNIWAQQHFAADNYRSLHLTRVDCHLPA